MLCSGIIGIVSLGVGEVVRSCKPLVIEPGLYIIGVLSGLDFSPWSNEESVVFSFCLPWWVGVYRLFDWWM